MKTTNIKAKTKKLKKEVQGKSRKTDDLEVQTWKEIDRSLVVRPLPPRRLVRSGLTT